MSPSLLARKLPHKARPVTNRTTHCKLCGSPVSGQPYHPILQEDKLGLREARGYVGNAQLAQSEMESNLTPVDSTPPL